MRASVVLLVPALTNIYALPADRRVTTVTRRPIFANSRLSKPLSTRLRGERAGEGGGLADIACLMPFTRHIPGQGVLEFEQCGMVLSQFSRSSHWLRDLFVNDRGEPCLR